MIENEDMKEFEWLEKGIKILINPTDKDYKGKTVGHLLPNMFSKYIKILHPISKMDLRINSNKIYSEGLDNEVIPGDRILWRQLALEYNVEFKPEINTY